MFFHISYVFDPEHREGAQARFMETGALPPEGVTMHGRWHSVSGRRGFLIAESSDASAVASWLQEWTDLLTFETHVVLNDEEFAAVLA